MPVNKRPTRGRKPSRTYKVGYCRPPIEHQIKPGERRNPKGRPKAMKPESGNAIALFRDFKKLMDKKVDVYEGGRKRRISFRELYLEKYGRLALDNPKLLPQFFKLMEKADQAAIDGRTGETNELIITGGLPEPDECARILREAGILGDLPTNADGATPKREDPDDPTTK